MQFFRKLIFLSLLVFGGLACAPATARFSFPPEWARHDAVWLGWSYDSSHHPVQIEIIRALAPTVPIRLLVTSDEARAEAEAALEAAGVARDRVELFTHPVSNVWIRDAGPRFLTDGRNLAVADFSWNWYGYPEEMSRGWRTRGGIDDDLARDLGLPLVSTDVVAEGGGLDVSSSVILTSRPVEWERGIWGLGGATICASSVCPVAGPSSSVPHPPRFLAALLRKQNWLEVGWGHTFAVLSGSQPKTATLALAAGWGRSP